MNFEGFIYFMRSFSVQINLSDQKRAQEKENLSQPLLTTFNVMRLIKINSHSNKLSLKKGNIIQTY